MSYLIGMYVYYHGNNLPLFGFDKGAMEIENQNQGLELPISEIVVDSLNVSQEVKNMVKSQQEKESNTINYEEMMKKAIFESQQESYRLQQSSINIDTAYSNTPDYLVDEVDPGNFGTIPMSLFDELNGF